MHVLVLCTRLGKQPGSYSKHNCMLVRGVFVHARQPEQMATDARPFMLSSEEDKQPIYCLTLPVLWQHTNSTQYLAKQLCSEVATVCGCCKCGCDCTTVLSCAICTLICISMNIDFQPPLTGICKSAWGNSRIQQQMLRTTHAVDNCFYMPRCCCMPKQQQQQVHMCFV
jgi:hypothetical protein